MIQGTTESGFAFSVKEELKDDMELLDMLAELDEENGLALSRVCLKLLGKVQRQAMYDHLRDDDGIVTVTRVGEEIRDIFAAMGNAGKNSELLPG